MGKIFAVGDIHGCVSKLADIMNKIGIDSAVDTLVFIGDYIDRGSDPKGVIDYILKIKETVGHLVCLQGNHESMFLNYYCRGRDTMLYLVNGGRQTLLSYQSDTDATRGGKICVPERHLDFFKSLQMYHETSDYIFVHAGLRPGIPLEKQDSEDMLWIRHEFIDSSYDFGKRIIFGHTPLRAPLFDSTKIGIDTGAVYGGKLTCLKLPDMIIYQV